MKILVVEDDLVSRLVMQQYVAPFGLAHIAVNGHEAVKAVRESLEAKQPYDLICMDIMMPDMDGHQALKEIRALEEAWGIFSSDGAKILMVSALSDIQNKINAFSSLCDGYLTKPIHKEEFLDELRGLKLIP